jgi:serine palmitoyltransferase
MPDLAALHVLKQRYLFTLYCDEAHSFLSLGRSGQGCLEMWNDLNPDALLPHTLIDIRTAGISKAILALGGFVCATKRFAEKLRSKSDEFHQRGECLATPAILQALWVLSRPLQLQASISRLREISRFCHKELRRAGIFVYGNDFSPILPLYAGRPSKASELSYVLRKHGVVAVPFSKPAVPLWQSRVRIGLSAGFTDDDVNQLLKAIILSCNETDISRGNCRTNLRTLESFQSRRSMTENLSLEDEARSSLKTLHDMVDRQIVGLPASVDVHFSASPYFTISKEAVLAAGHHARVQYGLGAGGSRWTMGTYMPHIEVEALVSAMSCQQETLTYPESDTGLMSTIAALCRPIKDAREHYFLVPREAPLAVEDGFRAASRSSGTQRITYTDPEDLIASVEKLSKLRHANYITIYQSARNQGKCYQDFSHWTLLLRFRAAFTGMTMLVDDSTGLRDSRIGIVGTVDINAFASLLKARIIIYGSFFHSLGFNGAYLTGDAAVISELRYTSRCYVFTAAPPPYMFAMIKTVLLDRMEIMPLLNE